MSTSKPLVEDEAKRINVTQSPSISSDVERLRGKFVLRNYCVRQNNDG